MLEMFVLAVHLLPAPEPEWAARKRLLRERVSEVVAAGNLLYGRNDPPPRTTLARLHERHAAYDLAWDRLIFDLESVHHPEKFWHVYRETVPHEWAHKLNHAINGTRGHDEGFEVIFDALKGAAP